jgi:hypothetical protein
MITWLRKKASQTNIFYFILATIIIAVASFVPIIKTYNHLTIGGDVIIPLIPKFSYHNAYEWVEYANGQYASNDYFIWISLFFLLRVFFGSIYHSAFALQFLVLFFSGMGVYSIFNLFNTKNKWETPVGLYGYPLLKQVMADFAADRKYAHIFSIKENARILIGAEYNNEELSNDIKLLKEYSIKNNIISKLEWDNFIHQAKFDAKTLGDETSIL